MFRWRIWATLALLLVVADGPPTSQPNADRDRWNRVFTAAKPTFNTQPNAFLQHCLERIPAQGAALDVAMGQGRNAVLLAKHGLDTTGIDISDAAIDQAKKLAQQRGVKLQTEQTDALTFNYGEYRWDVISIIYFNPVRPILQRIKRGVKPGGYIVIEAFGSQATGGPPDDVKYERNELLGQFMDWRIIEYHDGDFEPDWHGPGKQNVMRLFAQKLPFPDTPPPSGTTGKR